MTSDEFPHSWMARIVELAKVIGALSVIASAGLAVYAWTFGPVGRFFAKVDKIVVDIAQLQQDVARANGEDRVIRQPDGMSYIREPVTQGEMVTMMLTIGRTRLGQACRLTDWVPIFVDGTNIPLPGRRAYPNRSLQQLGEGLETRRIEMIPPEELMPGRVTVYLALSYACLSQGGEKPVPDRTDVLAYMLLPGA
ncbi:hypothetical protein [Sagittula salina]|uniref:Uncharacterized protein n=1 Tax=Sagittula salina TaxID=2820268 RepID=A0A940S337_9RHOB|nr:hypothetical protein [Sagittula salina]MBP0484686.1 hypothetical protein [Sagittula salina]